MYENLKGESNISPQHTFFWDWAGKSAKLQTEIIPKQTVYKLMGVALEEETRFGVWTKLYIRSFS